jgi:hypothetical protein
MGLFRKRQKEIFFVPGQPQDQSPPAEEFTYVPPIDARVAECPNCHGALKKVPGAKTKCPLCAEFMFVRTNPHTRERVVVTEAQAEEIDDEIAKLNGTYDMRLAEKIRKEKVKADLTKSFGGKEPSEQDIRWRILNQDAMSYAKSKDWTSYMIAKNEMAEIQLKSNHAKDALRTFLDVAAMAINGADDVSMAVGMDAAMRKELDMVEFRPGNPVSLTHIRVEEIKKAGEALGMGIEEILEEFLQVCQSARLSKLPLGPEAAKECLRLILTY